MYFVAHFQELKTAWKVEGAATARSVRCKTKISQQTNHRKSYLGKSFVRMRGRTWSFMAKKRPLPQQLPQLQVESQDKAVHKATWPRHHDWGCCKLLCTVEISGNLAAKTHRQSNKINTSYLQRLRDSAQLRFRCVKPNLLRQQQGRSWSHLCFLVQASEDRTVIAGLKCPCVCRGGLK